MESKSGCIEGKSLAEKRELKLKEYLVKLPLTMADYQDLAKVTARFDKKAYDGRMYCAIGLSGEVGELNELIKKLFRDDEGILTEERKAKIKKEAGDVCWYLTMLLRECGLTLEEAAVSNLDKLFSRLAQGKIHGDGSDREEAGD